MNPHERAAEAAEALAQAVQPIDEAEATRRMAEIASEADIPAAPDVSDPDARSIRGYPNPAQGRNAALLTTPCG